MTLVGAILKKVKSNTSLQKRYPSPPPEVENIAVAKKKTKKIDKFAHVRPAVDSSPPRLDIAFMHRNLPTWRARILDAHANNVKLLLNIKRAHFSRGKVDSRWKVHPARSLLYYRKRCDFYKNVERENRLLYQRILDAVVKVPPTALLQQDWAKNKHQIISNARNRFVLFPPVPRDTIEDLAFVSPAGVTRPRVHLTLRVRNCADIGEIVVELFEEVCPHTCRLFLDLVDGDGLGYGYVGTCFFRKAPGLYWTGGDVVYNNGFGCYAQRGRRVPIGAESYRFSHSMPGLLSMRVTKDDEVCGIFNVTFKPLPQLDLRNVVFGRVVRPCKTFDAITNLGTPLSTWPIVEVVRTRRHTEQRWVTGLRNTRLYDEQKLRQRKIRKITTSMK